MCITTKNPFEDTFDCIFKIKRKIDFYFYFQFKKCYKEKSKEKKNEESKPGLVGKSFPDSICSSNHFIIFSI